MSGGNRFLKTAIVGIGRIYFDGHEAIYFNGKKFAPVALVDWNEKRANLAKERLIKKIKGKKEDWAETAVQNLKVYTSYDEMLDELDGELDLIDVCTHSKEHIPLAIKALERNINVQAEKPPGRTWLELEALVEAEQKSKAFYQLAEHVCFEKLTISMRNAVESGKLGDINYIEVNFGHGGPYWPYVVSKETGLPHFVDPILGGGGVLQDLAPHGISKAFWCLGDKTEIIDCKTDILERRVKDRKLSGKVVDSPVEDFAQATIGIKINPNSEPIPMKVTTSWCGHPGGDQTIIKGTKGTLKVGRTAFLKRRLPMIESDSGNKVFFKIPKDNYHKWHSKIRETQIFADQILKNEKSWCDSTYALKLQEIISLHYFSKMNKRLTTLEEMKNWGRQILEENNNDPFKASDEIIKNFVKSIDL